MNCSDIIDKLIAICIPLIVLFSQRHFDKVRQKTEDKAHQKEIKQMKEDNDKRTEVFRENNRLEAMPFFELNVVETKAKVGDGINLFKMELKNTGMNAGLVESFTVEGTKIETNGTVLFANINPKLCSVEADMQQAMITPGSSRVLKMEVADSEPGGVDQISHSEDTLSLQVYFRDLIGDNYSQLIKIHYMRVLKEIKNIEILYDFPVIIQDKV